MNISLNAKFKKISMEKVNNYFKILIIQLKQAIIDIDTTIVRLDEAETLN